MLEESQSQQNPELLTGEILRAQIQARTAELFAQSLNPSFIFRAVADVRTMDRLIDTLPEGTAAHKGQLQTLPGGALAALNYADIKMGRAWRNNSGGDIPTSVEEAYGFVDSILTNPDGAQIAGANLLRPHIVSYPRRVAPLQYILPLLGLDLNILDAGAAMNISLPLLNHPKVTEQEFEGRKKLMKLVKEVPMVSIKQGLGVDIQEQERDWVEAGFYRSGTRPDRISDFNLAYDVAQAQRERFPQLIADVLQLDPESYAGKFDAVSAIFLMHQLDDPHAFFAKSAELLRDKGILITMGEELIQGWQKQNHRSEWAVKVYQKQEGEMRYVVTPFYLQPDQVTVGRVDIAEYQKLAVSLGFNLAA